MIHGENNIQVVDRVFFEEGFYKDDKGFKSMVSKFKLIDEDENNKVCIIDYMSGNDFSRLKEQPACSKTKAVWFQQIDRGVSAFDLASTFPNLLQNKFPNLRCLFIEQNYSISYAHESIQELFESFLTHKFIQNLELLMMVDIQSHFDINPDILKRSLPSNKQACRILAVNDQRRTQINHVHESHWPQDEEGYDVEPESNWIGICQEERDRLKKDAPWLDGFSPRPNSDCNRMVTITK